MSEPAGTSGTTQTEESVRNGRVSWIDALACRCPPAASVGVTPLALVMGTLCLSEVHSPNKDFYNPRRLFVYPTFVRDCRPLGICRERGFADHTLRRLRRPPSPGPSPLCHRIRKNEEAMTSKLGAASPACIGALEWQVKVTYRPRRQQGSPADAGPFRRGDG